MYSSIVFIPIKKGNHKEEEIGIGNVAEDMNIRHSKDLSIGTDDRSIGDNGCNP
jgi:hypothetical protein